MLTRLSVSTNNMTNTKNGFDGKLGDSLKHGSLFSGIGGFDLAAEWMGWENVFHCEWNEFGQRILKHYWPKAISYEDITKTDFSIHRGKIDILTGGFPCQPYSSAGKRLGKEDNRHLWPEMLRAIREIKPKYIVGENVSGIISWNEGLVFNEVQTDLENEGYEVQPCVLPAAAVNAPHRRDRVWFVAYRANTRTESVRSRRKNSVYEFESTTNSSSNGHELRRFGKDRQEKGTFQSEGDKREWFWNDDWRNGEQKNVTNPDFKRFQGRKIGHKSKERQESNEEQSRRCDKLPRQKWEEFPTQSPICSGNDGLSNQLDGITFPKWRQESIKAYGNAIVPQVAYQIFKALMETEAKEC